MDRKTHWERVYGATQPSAVSWYQPRPVRSIELLAEAGLGPESSIIDIGGGDSTLVDALIERHVRHVTVLDISGAALLRAQARLGPRAADVAWLEADATRANLAPSAYDIWHDRAVFHFLTEPRDRARYVATAAAALRPGGTLLVATFALDGPTHCSGLAVARYSPEGLAREFGDGFTCLRGSGELHRTPTGQEQQFTYVTLRRG